MTIEELASTTEEGKYTLKSERTYNNIRKMRNQILMRGFLRKNTQNNHHTVAVVSGVEYINAVGVHNINSAWLLFSKTAKNIIWIVNKGTVSRDEIKSVSSTLGSKIRQVFITNASKDDILQNTSMAAKIATIDDCIIFTSFEQDSCVNTFLSKVFEEKVFSM